MEFIGPKLETLGFSLIYRSDKRNQFLRIIDMLFALLFKRDQYDLVLIDTYSTKAFYYAYFSAKICQYLEKPYICILHGGGLPNRIKLDKKKCDKVFQRARTNVVLSGYLAELMEQNKYPYTVIPNFIEINNYRVGHNDLQRVLWVRSFHRKYRPVDAVLVIKHLVQSIPEIQLIMIGPDKDGSLAEVKRIVESERLEASVVFHGKLSKNEWIKIGQDCKVFLNTTSIDNFPVSVIEAMALSLPVVTTKAGGVPWIVKDGINGYLTDIGDTELMASYIQELLMDDALFKKISKNARNSAEEYCWEKVAPKWEEVLS